MVGGDTCLLVKPNVRIFAGGFLLLGTHWADAEFFQAPADHVMPHGWYHHNFATACDWVTSPVSYTI